MRRRTAIGLFVMVALGFPWPSAGAAEPAPAPPKGAPSQSPSLAPSPAPCPAPCFVPASPCGDPCDPRNEPRRGPPEIRDIWVLAQPRLTLPATSPDTLGRCQWQVRATFLWGNSFGWRQDVTGENPGYRAFIVDGETRTLDATVMRGVTDDLDVGLRLPLHWRGAGVLDEIVDTFHEWTSFITMDNLRPDFDTNVYRVNGHLEDGTPFDEDDEKGLGLGNAEAIVRWRFLDGGRDCLSMAVVGRLTVPTGTGPFETSGLEAGAQVVAAHRIAPRWDLFAGLGATWYEDATYQSIEYETWRGYAFFAVEYRPWKRWSFVLETNFASALVTDVHEYPAVQWYLDLSAKYDLDARTQLELGLVENLEDQQSTTDVAFHFGVVRRF